MKAILLAAGFGTRLRPLTDTTPKCLVPIKGKPLLQIWLERLSDAGIGPFLINTHYLSDRVEAFVNSSPFKAQIELVHEKELLGTAGTLRKNIDFFDNDDGLLIHADNYCLADFNNFVEAHKRRPQSCLMTMMTFTTERPESCGIVETNDRRILVNFLEKVKDPPSNKANGAIYALSRELLRTIRTDFTHASDFSTEVIPSVLNKIYTYHTNDILVDIGSPEQYQKAQYL